MNTQKTEVARVCVCVQILAYMAENKRRLCTLIALTVFLCLSYWSLHNYDDQTGEFYLYDQPASSNLNCTWPKLTFRQPPGPLTALASKPGSGNTWVRHLIQLATGIQTGSIYHELRLQRNGFPGEGISNGSVVAIKSHHLDDEEV